MRSLGGTVGEFGLSDGTRQKIAPSYGPGLRSSSTARLRVFAAAVLFAGVYSAAATRTRREGTASIRPTIIVSAYAPTKRTIEERATTVIRRGGDYVCIPLSELDGSRRRRIREESLRRFCETGTRYRPPMLPAPAFRAGMPNGEFRLSRALRAFELIGLAEYCSFLIGYFFALFLNQTTKVSFSECEEKSGLLLLGRQMVRSRARGVFLFSTCPSKPNPPAGGSFLTVSALSWKYPGRVADADGGSAVVFGSGGLARAFPVLRSDFFAARRRRGGFGVAWAPAGLRRLACR